jgi:hypothetical protein
LIVLILVLIMQAAYPLVIALAALKGDRPERQAAAAILVCWVATLVFQDDAHRFGAYATVVAMSACDFALLVALALIAARSRRGWPVWAAGFQAIAMFPHVIRLLNLKIKGSVFVTTLDISGYGVLIALAVGTIVAWRERATLKSMADSLREPQFRF